MNRHNCTIIIDTNQFCADYMLSGMRWKQLSEYLSTTDACIQMPSVVWEEIKRNYTKHVTALFSNANSAIERLNHHTQFRAPHFNFLGIRFEIDKNFGGFSIEDLVERYLSFIKQKLQLKSKDYLRWDKNWFDDIVKRAICHAKPFGDESDKGFKDTLLWKTILSLEKRPGFKNEPVILISSNSKDFGDPSKKGEIHPALAIEARNMGLDLHYFDSLDSFLEKWANDAITMNLKRIKQSIPEAMLKSALSKHVSPWLRKNEAPEPNIFFSGTNYKIESEAPGKLAIRVSASGYITNTWTSHEYLDFNSEAIYREKQGVKNITIEAFSAITEDKLLPQNLWSEFADFLY